MIQMQINTSEETKKPAAIATTEYYTAGFNIYIIFS